MQGSAPLTTGALPDVQALPWAEIRRDIRVRVPDHRDRARLSSGISVRLPDDRCPGVRPRRQKAVGMACQADAVPSAMKASPLKHPCQPSPRSWLKLTHYRPARSDSVPWHAVSLDPAGGKTAAPGRSDPAAESPPSAPRKASSNKRSSPSSLPNLAPPLGRRAGPLRPFHDRALVLPAHHGPARTGGGTRPQGASRRRHPSKARSRSSSAASVSYAG